MKKLIWSIVIVIGILGISEATRAQIPNAGFEAWEHGQPIGWNDFSNRGIAGVIHPTDSAHHGKLALEGIVQRLLATDSITSPFLATATFDEASKKYRLGFPYKGKPEFLTGHFQFGPVQGDELYITMELMKGNKLIGAAEWQSEESTKEFTEFSAPFGYYQDESLEPDTAILIITLRNGSEMGGLPHEGSWFVIDDLSLEASLEASLSTLKASDQDVRLEQNYPNPFRPTTTIGFSIPQAGEVSLKIFSLRGEEIATILNGYADKGHHTVGYTAANIPAGTYIYQLESGNYRIARQFQVLK